MRIAMELSRILICEHTGAQMIELRELDPISGQSRWFPIVIGTIEALAIRDGVTDKAHARPQTHDLLVSTIEGLGATLISITITNLEHGTFYATLDLIDSIGESIEVDARPSDAIALAMIQSADIYVEDCVLQLATIGMIDENER
ncbi:MAG: bifunctional nuclease family protein [Phycisphaerales bacterium]|nr:bifunctional nuclease family protein [Phycisphaerales bacterium]